MHNPWLLVLTGEVSRSSFLDPTVRKCPFVLSEPPDSRWHLDLDLKVGFTELVFMQHDRDLHALGASSKDKWWLILYGCDALASIISNFQSTKAFKCTDEDWKVYSVIIFEKLTSSLNVPVDQQLLMAILVWVFTTFLAIRAQMYY